MSRYIIIFAIFELPILLFGQTYELVVPLGHTNQINSIELNLNKTTLASADGSAKVILWDYSTGKELFHLHHKFGVEKLVWLDSTTLLTASKGGELKIWQPNGRLIKKMDFEGDEITAIDVVGDEFLLGFSSSKLMRFNSDLLEISRIETNGIPSSIESNPNNIFIGYKSGLMEKFSYPKIRSLAIDTASLNSISSIYSNLDNIYVLSSGGYLIKMDTILRVKEKVKLFNKRGYELKWDFIGNQLIASGRDEKSNLKVITANFEIENNDYAIPSTGTSWKFDLGIKGLSTTDSTLLVANYNNEIQEFSLKEQKSLKRSFKGQASSINAIALNVDKRQLAIATNQNEIKVLNLTGLGIDRLLMGHQEGVRSVDFHPSKSILASSGADDKIRIWDVDSSKMTFLMNAKGEYNSTPIRFDPTGNYILKKNSAKDFDLYNFKSKRPRNVKIRNGFDFKYSKDGTKLLFRIRDKIQIADAISLDIINELEIDQIKDFIVEKDNRILVLLRDRKTLKWFDISTGKELGAFYLQEVEIDRLGYIDDKGVFLCYTNKINSGALPDYSIYVIDSKDGHKIKGLNGHNGFITGVKEVNGRYLTSAKDGIINIWDNKFENLGKLIPLKGNEYVVISPNGLFDATERAISQLHYINDNKVIGVEQFKDLYFEPSLLSKILGFNNEDIRKANNLQGVKMYPEFELEHPYLNDGFLGININESGGGVGRVVVIINGKELPTDIRGGESVDPEGNIKLSYDISHHPFLYENKISSIDISVYNEDNTLRSEKRTIRMPPIDLPKSKEKPKFYAVIVGTSDYMGKALDLNYAAKDAMDFSNALNLSAVSLLGEENVNIHLLTTENDDKTQWPFKKNIKKAFELVAEKAISKDILVIYLAGHGVNLSGENSDFYYLTPSAVDGNLSNDQVRNEAAISSEELTSYIQSIAALKQVLILDACHSGKAASLITKPRAVVSSTQKRALESMKDKTGLHVLAGSAADAVSYETTLFGQGLLTYALLFGMKGAALHNNEYVDVISLLQFAARKVPELAQDIGGIQQPEVKSPVNSESFYLGKLDDFEQSKIIIEEPKPIFVHTRFQSNDTFIDHLHIGDAVDNRLLDISNQRESNIVFLDTKKFNGAYVVAGRYELKGGLISVSVNVFKDELLIKSFENKAVNSSLSSENIVSELIKITH